MPLSFAETIECNTNTCYNILMSTFEIPALPRDDDDYSQFKEALVAIHQAVAPECDPGFSQGGMRHANADGSRYYFPHPDDREEVLSSARKLSVGADDARRSLIVPVGILAAHPYNGSGRTSRAYHARLVGMSSSEIEKLKICGPRVWLGTDEDAHEIIDLRPPEALLPYIEDYVYDEAGIERQTSLQQSFAILSRGVAEYKEVVGRLPEDYQSDLNEAFEVGPFNKDFYVRIEDPASLAFALDAQTQKQGNEDLPEGISDLVGAMTRLGEDNLAQLVEDMWRFRRLRALANIACLGDGSLGSRVVSVPGHEEPLAITDHYVQLTNNLVMSQ